MGSACSTSAILSVNLLISFLNDKLSNLHLKRISDQYVISIQPVERSDYTNIWVYGSKNVYLSIFNIPISLNVIFKFSIPNFSPLKCAASADQGEL